MNLLLLLFFCHFLADFTWLSRPFMLAAKKLGKPVLPILCHGLVHGVLMGLVLLGLHVAFLLAFALFILVVVSHTAIDSGKGLLQTRFPLFQNPASTWHWVLFGFDQYAHAAIIILVWHLAIT